MLPCVELRREGGGGLTAVEQDAVRTSGIETSDVRYCKHSLASQRGSISRD
jgi:hypothetical protein